MTYKPKPAPPPDGAGERPKRAVHGYSIGLWLTIAVAIFAGYSCGPEVICYGKGGQPAQSAIGLEWCELDGNNRLSDGDTSLRW